MPISYDEWLFGPSPLIDPKKLSERLLEGAGLEYDQALEPGANQAVEGASKLQVQSSGWKKIS